MTETPDDYTALVSSLLGITPAHLGAVLLWLVSIATVAGLVTPWLSEAVPRWRAHADSTATLHDDRAVRVAAHVLQALLVVAAFTAWVVPRFAIGLDKAREAKLLEERK